MTLKQLLEPFNMKQLQSLSLLEILHIIFEDLMDIEKSER